MKAFYSKKIVCFLVLTSLFWPQPALSKGRDIVMVISGTLVLAGGVTFIIKSTEKKSEEKKIVIQPWLPKETYEDPFHR